MAILLNCFMHRKGLYILMLLFQKIRKQNLFWQNWDMNQANNSFYLNWRNILIDLTWIYSVDWLNYITWTYGLKSFHFSLTALLLVRVERLVALRRYFCLRYFCLRNVNAITCHSISALFIPLGFRRGFFLMFWKTSN